MLVRFSVTNFLSFKKQTEFSMVAGSSKRHGNHVATCNDKRLLKGSFIFGANAGGKSNLIKAIDFARSIIVSGFNSVDFEKKYFRIDPECKTMPGVFQFDIFSGGHFYSYGFSLSYINASIEEEWLYRVDDPDNEVCLFLRSKKDSEYNFDVFSNIEFEDQGQTSRFQVYLADIASPSMRRTLFLRDVVKRTNNAVEYQPFRDVMDWFYHLMIVSPDSKYENIIRLLDDDDEKTRLQQLLKYFDTGIISISKKELDFDRAFAKLSEKDINYIKNEISQGLIKVHSASAFVWHNSLLFEIKKNADGELVVYEVVSSHGNDNDLFEYSNESDGTKRLFDLIPLFQKLSSGYVVIVDELDRSLHTKVVLEFIKCFYQLTEDIFSQLIVTTHDSNVIDLQVVRRDEIWFIERNKDHCSELYSLNKFQDKFNENIIDKDYLLGRYGAVPIFRNLALPNSNLDSIE